MTFMRRWGSVATDWMFEEAEELLLFVLDVRMYGGFTLFKLPSAGGTH